MSHQQKEQQDSQELLDEKEEGNKNIECESSLAKKETSSLHPDG